MEFLQQPPRQLVAVMFTDMVGYTALIQADELTAVDKRDRYIGAIERHHQSFDGTIVQRLGDGTMSMFPSSLAAVLAAVAIQRELARQDIPIRIGVHVGEVVVEPERLTGEAVNIASRVDSVAVPGAVLLSDAARDQLKNRSDVHLINLGRFRLKNVGRPLEFYAVAADGIVVPDPGTAAYATASRGPMRSDPSSAESPRRATSRLPSTHCWRVPGAVT